MMRRSDHREVLVLGGGYAGVVAALRLSRQSYGAGVRITLINGRDHFVERIRLHQLATGQTLPPLPYSRLLRGSDVGFLQGWVTQLNPQQQCVRVATATGEMTLSYDYLVYAVGSVVDTKTVAGVAQNAFSLSSEETTRTLQQTLPGIARGGRVVVCGGGLTGIEAASELATRYPEMTLMLLTADRFGEQLTPGAQAYLREAFAHLGIAVVDRQRVTAVDATQLQVENGSVYPFDLCLWAGSFRAPALAREAGLPVNERDQVIVDEHLRVSGWPTIYAIGDAATLEEALTVPIRMGCVTAAPMGSYTGNHLGALLRGTPLPPPYRYRYLMRCISLGRRDAIVQFVAADDTPKTSFLHGRLAAVVKELVSRSSIWNLQLEQKYAAWRRLLPVRPVRQAGNVTPHSRSLS